MSLVDQLVWALQDTADKASRSLFNSSVALSTDIGVVRSENQDRVSFARIGPRGTNEPINLVIVSDGMGGMDSGATCATLATAAFIEALAKEPSSSSLAHRLENAAYAANEAVYRKFSGRGGATLSAIAWRSGQEVFTVNIGDSRIYHQLQSADGELTRLTVDDTLSEAFGGEGKALIQFIGLGKGLKPHVHAALPVGILIATTDGVHFMNSEVMTDVFRHASSPKSKVDRITALARWLGGPDNASIAAVDIQGFPQSHHEEIPLIQLWPCGSDQTLVWLAEERLTPPQDSTKSTDNKDNRKPKALNKKKLAKDKAKAEAQGRLQIEIDVDDETDADSK